MADSNRFVPVGTLPNVILALTERVEVVTTDEIKSLAVESDLLGSIDIPASWRRSESEIKVELDFKRATSGTSNEIVLVAILVSTPKMLKPIGININDKNKKKIIFLANIINRISVRFLINQKQAKQHKQMVSVIWLVLSILEIG